MAQRTDVEVSPNLPSTQDPNAQSAPPQSETHSAVPPPPGSARSRFRRNPATRWLIIGAVLAVLIGGFFAWRYVASYESTDDAKVDGHLMPLSARISGYVLKVNVDDNPRIAQQFQILSIPTLMVFKNGTTFRRQVGANPGIIPSMIEDALR